MKKYLYIITNLSMPNICKVGITDDIDKRLKNLNSKTAVPTRFQLYEKFDLKNIKNVELMEQAILQYFADKRINKRREFLQVHPERICDFIKDNKNKLKATDIKTGFEKLGINIGETLYFTDGGDLYRNITAITSTNKKVIYKGKKMSLTAAALEVLDKKFGKKWQSARGPIYWKYRNQTIAEWETLNIKVK